MHIFIDESGTFARSGARFSISAVGALIIPDASLDRLFKKYEQLRPRLPKEGGEVKGRLLNEQQVAAVLDLARRSNGIFEAIAINPDWHSVAEFKEYRDGQAAGMTNRLGPEHHPNLVAEIHRLRDQMLALPEQQFLQALASLKLLNRVGDIATLYYALRQPKELTAYHWVIDAKDRSGETNWEAWWKQFMLPWLQSHSIRAPMTMMHGADYRFFERFRSTMPDFMGEELEGAEATDLKLMMTEHFRFSSAVEPGLELADIAINAYRRTLTGNIQQPAWSAIKALTVHRNGGCLGLITVGRPGTAEFPRGSGAMFLVDGGRSMLTRRIYGEN